METTNPAGRLSVKLTLVSATPELLLVTVNDNDVEALSGIVAAPKAFVNDGAAMTFKTAVLLVKPVPPCVEEIAVVVLFFTPSVVPVTLTIIVQVEFAALVNPETVMTLAPAVAVIVPAPQLLTRAFGVATTNPAGRLSVNPTFVKAVAGLALPMVKVKVVVPFKAIFVAPNALVIVGGWTTVVVAVVLLILMPPSAVICAVFATEKSLVGMFASTVALN